MTGEQLIMETDKSKLDERYRQVVQSRMVSQPESRFDLDGQFVWVSWEAL